MILYAMMGFSVLRIKEISQKYDLPVAIKFRIKKKKKFENFVLIRIGIESLPHAQTFQSLYLCNIIV